MFNPFFEELRAVLDDFRNERRYGVRTRTLTVAKPFCTPARDTIMTIFSTYGVRVYDYRENTRNMTPKMMWRNRFLKGGEIPALPLATVATIVVSAKAAAWAEYLLIRSRKLYRVGNYFEPKNEQWALRHNGRLPPAWDRQEPWIEASCRSGIVAWQDYLREAQDGAA